MLGSECELRGSFRRISAGSFRRRRVLVELDSTQSVLVRTCTRVQQMMRVRLYSAPSPVVAISTACFFSIFMMAVCWDRTSPTDRCERRRIRCCCSKDAMMLARKTRGVLGRGSACSAAVLCCLLLLLLLHPPQGGDVLVQGFQAGGNLAARRWTATTGAARTIQLPASCAGLARGSTNTRKPASFLLASSASVSSGSASAVRGDNQNETVEKTGRWWQFWKKRKKRAIRPSSVLTSINDDDTPTRRPLVRGKKNRLLQMAAVLLSVLVWRPVTALAGGGGFGGASSGPVVPMER